MTVSASSAFEWVQALAGAVAALAALGTLVFAWLTVRGAQALRRDERRVHLLDLAADYGEAGLRSLGSADHEAQTRVRITGHRFRAALEATGKPLPACHALLMVQWFPPPGMGDYDRRVDAADRALTTALDELAEWLRE
jgi:hypothetical protein